MATVPGDPNEPTAQPQQPQFTMAEALQAAAIMDQKGKFKVAGDVVKFPGLASSPAGHEKDIEDDPKAQTRRVLGRVLGGAKVLPIRPEEEEK